MRYHVASLSRAKTIARNLSDLAKSIAGCDILLTDAQGAVAQILGYQNWAELKSVVSAQAQGPMTDLDEMLPPADLRNRLNHQATVLMACFGFHQEAAALIVAHLRATAHPAGPHRVEGPSSRLNLRGTSREFRGCHANGKPILFVDGCERRLVLRVEPVQAGERADTEDVGPYHPSNFLNDGACLRLRNGEAVGIFGDLDVHRRHPDGMHDLLPWEFKLHAVDDVLSRLSRGHRKGCLQTKGDDPSITMLHDDHWHTVVARLPSIGPGNPVLRVRIGTDSQYGRMEVSCALMGKLDPDQVADEDGMPAGAEFDILSWLDACGLKVPKCTGWRPARWTAHLQKSVLHDPGFTAWRRVLANVDLTAFNARIDVEAMQWLLYANDPFLASDVNAYNAVRDAPGNEAARTCLREWPFLFGVIWASPEFRRATLPIDEIRSRLIHAGTSTSHGRCGRGIPPVPGYVLEWLRGKDDLGGYLNFSGFRDILEGLTVLGPDRLPRSNREFHALEEIFRHLYKCLPSPAKTIGADVLHAMMLAGSAKMDMEQGVGAVPETIL